MPTVEDKIIILAEREAVFALSQDYELRLQWDPYLRIARMLDGTNSPAIGKQVYCESHKGIGMTVEYITWKPPEQTAMKMTDKKWIFKSFSGSWRFLEVAGGTEVIFRYNFKGKWGLLNPILNSVVTRLLRTDLSKRLIGLKKAIEVDGILENH